MKPLSVPRSYEVSTAQPRSGTPRLHGAPGAPEPHLLRAQIRRGLTVASSTLTLLFGLALAAGAAGQQSPAPTAVEKRWALAASAMLTERNRHRHDLLGGAEQSDATVRATRRLLSEWWGVNNRDDLLRALKWIDDSGHRTEFERLLAKLTPMSAEQRADLHDKMKHDQVLAHRVSFVERHAARLGPKSLIGWDYTRFISLCRWGYLVGHLSEQEAWLRIMRAARLLQRTFDSWRDLGENYLIGREFWSPEETAQTGDLYRIAYRRLLIDSKSPWNLYPWNTDLGG